MSWCRRSPTAGAVLASGVALAWLALAWLSLAPGLAFAQIETAPPQTASPIPQPGPAPPKPGGKPPPAPVHAPFGGLGISQIETSDLRLLYFDPTETYLTPYVGRALENSIAFQKRLYGWQPWDRTTVLLKDFSDYGNAAARASPNNALLVDIAPLSQTFETFSAGERFFTLANHEMTHVATMDVWNGRDAFWRRAFFGKPMPIEEHPES